MVQAPCFDLVVTPADAIRVCGRASKPTLQRVEALWRSFVERLPGLQNGNVQIELNEVVPPHAGLGAGTQLSLAVAAVATRLIDRSVCGAELARWTDRGVRSAIGVHGFGQGGFLVDGGKSATSRIAPLVARCDFPLNWPILLIQPDLPQGLHGEVERQVFERTTPSADATTDRLARLLLLGLLPALCEGDYASFAEALFEYNHTVGVSFQFAQGDCYAHPRCSEIVRTIRQWNVAAVGQTSWGPAIFVVLPDDDQAQWLGRRLQRDVLEAADRVWSTTASNQGARIEVQ